MQGWRVIDHSSDHSSAHSSEGSSERFSHRAEIVWEPAADAFAASQMGEFAAAVGRADVSYAALHAWSISELSTFWESFAEWAGVRWHQRPERALDELAMPANWFNGGTLNYAEHALAGDAGVVSLSQSRPRIELSAAELRAQVAACRAGLESLGVSRGDCVAAYLPNISETIVAFLATASLGAVWSSCAPEFGVRAVTDRFSQLEPVVLLAIDGYRYGTRTIDRRVELAQITAGLPSLRQVVTLPYLDWGDGDGDDDAIRASPQAPDAPAGPAPVHHLWADLLAVDAPATDAAIAFEPVPFDHPLYVLFSSGTTGLPKPIVHGHGGITLEHLKIHRLHHDLRPGQRFMWFTTTGWMMWNYLVSGLAAGATVVCFDGDPVAPAPDELWRIAAEERLDVLGVSATLITSHRKLGLEPGMVHDLSRLRQVGSTGAPLPADGFRWVCEAVGAQIQPCSVSGGTDVCTAFVGTAPSVPVRAGEISVSILGCDVQAVHPDGTPCPPGVTGELVVTRPMPSMPVGLWGDTTGERYRATYFEAFPGTWHHGDWITFFDDGACQITGRSDATLNRGGVRLGTADFYAVVEGLGSVNDSLVVHLEDDEGGPGTLYLLVVPAPGTDVDDDVRRAISTALRTELSPRHVPDVIEAVPAVPRTLSGKKLEIPVKRLLLGVAVDRVASRESLADPAAWDAVVAWAQARRAG